MREYLKDNIIVSENDNEVFFKECGDGVNLNEYLESNEFYHYQKDSYTDVELDSIYKVLNDYKKQKMDTNVNYAISIATGWWIHYLMTPALKEESVLKTMARLLISWRSIYQYNIPISVIDNFERQFKSRLKKELIYNDEVIIEAGNNSILKDAMVESNCIGSINDDVKMTISKNKVILYQGNTQTTLYYNYEKTKKK